MSVLGQTLIPSTNGLQDDENVHPKRQVDTVYSIQ